MANNIIYSHILWKQPIKHSQRLKESFLKLLIPPSLVQTKFGSLSIDNWSGTIKDGSFMKDKLSEFQENAVNTNVLFLKLHSKKIMIIESLKKWMKRPTLEFN